MIFSFFDFLVYKTKPILKINYQKKYTYLNNFGPINKLAGKLIEIPWDSKEIIEATYIADTLLCISVTCFNVIDTSKLFQNK